MSNRVFYSWVNPKLDLVLLLILAVCTGISSGISPQISTYMVSGLSTNPANAAMCNYAYFAGMTVAFSIIDRIQNYFSVKQLFSCICIGLIFCNMLLTMTDSASLIVMTTFIIGIFRIMGAILIVVNLAPILMPQGERYMLYCVYFPITLLVSPLGGLAMAYMANHINWRFAFHFCNLLLFIGLVVTLAFVHNKQPKRRLAMWKFDWFAHFLIAGWMLSFIYLLVYGRINDWYDSRNTWLATIIFLFCFGFLMIRNTVHKKPILRFQIFRQRNIRVGLVIMFFFGAFFTMTNTMNTLMNIAFHSNPLLNAQINSIPVIGYLIGTVLCYFYFKKYTNFKVMILVAITFYWLSCLILYFLIDTQIEPSLLAVPMILRGIAIIISYITIGLYVTAEVPKAYLSIIPFFLIFFRSFLGPTIWGNLYSNYLAIRQVKLMDQLATWSASDLSDPIMMQRFGQIHGQNIDTVKIYNVYHQQAVMASLKDLLGYLCIGGIIFFLYIAILPIYKKMDRNIFNWKKRSNQEDIAATVVS